MFSNLQVCRWSRLEKRVYESSVTKKSEIECKKLKLEKYSGKEKNVPSDEKIRQHSRKRSNSPDHRKHARSYRHERPESRKTHIHQRSRSRETHKRQRSRNRETHTRQRSRSRETHAHKRSRSHDIHTHQRSYRH